MADQLWRGLIVISTALLVGTVLLFLSGVVMNPWDHYLSLGDEFHLGVWGRGINTYFVVFSDAEYGPYRGSIISLNGDPPFDRVVKIGPSWGIYFRYFQDADGALWTLMVSLWYPIAISAVLPVVHMLSLRNRRRST
jgi:hypothetical protein